MSELSVVKKKYISYINNIIKNRKISHSYLIELSNYEEDFCFVLDFIKMILLNVEYEDLGTIHNNVIHLIDNNSYPDVRIIEPEGSFIKKNNLRDLQKDYSNKSLLGGKRFYIIKEADKLNTASANTMLKFLEDPEDDIIAFLLTDNRYHVLETILSRCQILTLKDDFFSFSDEDNSIYDLLSIIFNPTQFFLHYKYYIENIIVDKKVAKEKLQIIEQLIINYLHSKYLFYDIGAKYNAILSCVEESCLLNALSIVEKELQKLDFNVNYKLWVDSFFSKLILGGKSYD